jgi:hypothetical protein
MTYEATKVFAIRTMKTQLKKKNTHIWRTNVLQKLAVPYVGISFWLGAKNEGQRHEDIFKFRVSEMPFPGLWESFDRILMVRKRVSYVEIYNLLAI